MNVQELVAKLRTMDDEEEIEDVIFKAASEHTMSVFEDALRTKWTFNGKRYYEDTVSLWQLMYAYIDEKVGDEYYQV